MNETAAKGHNRRPTGRDIDRGKALGAYLGAAIGDAMGGPVEGSHRLRIKRTVGTVTGLLPYEEHYTPLGRRREYMRSHETGAVTDDTFIRADMTRFFLENPGERTPERLAEWCNAKADFSNWWTPVADHVKRVGRGEMPAAEAGRTFMQGGGNGWWTPVGILHAGNWAGAEAEIRSLSRIWKRGLEQDLLCATQTGLATAMTPGATFADVMEGILKPCGPLARTLIGRGFAVGLAAADMEGLAEAVYDRMLFASAGPDDLGDEPTDRVDAPLPPSVPPTGDTDDLYLGLYFAEQIPIACAAFAFGRGDPERTIPAAVNIGRDCDSFATTAGSWCGALWGEAGLPHDWVRTVADANRDVVDIRGLAEALVDGAS